MLDCVDDIDSDMSVFHRVEDPMQLSPPRYFRLAERLEHYGGAVTAARAVQRPVRESRREVTAHWAAAAAAGTPDDIAAMAAMSQNPGFPGIGYSGG